MNIIDKLCYVTKHLIEGWFEKKELGRLDTIYDTYPNLYSESSPATFKMYLQNFQESSRTEQLNALIWFGCDLDENIDDIFGEEVKKEASYVKIGDKPLEDCSVIDFSKKPEGATFFIPDNEFCVFNWVKVVDGKLMIRGLYDGEWKAGVDGSFVQNHMVEIPIDLTVTCNNERELMLCNQLLRMCRGEESQVCELKPTDLMSNDKCWITYHDNGVLLIRDGIEYRTPLKPKKELIVPWEWIDERFNAVNANRNGIWALIHGDDESWVSLPLKLDLTDIELPITVNRPN